MDSRNLILAIVLSVAIMLGFDWYFAKRFAPSPAPPPAEQVQPSVQSPPAPGEAAPPAAPTAATASPAATAAPAGAPSETSVDRAAALAGANRIKIDAPHLHGSIAEIGGRLDDLTLAAYRETVNPTSPEIVLLSPANALHPYFAEFGWVGNGPRLPGRNTPWRADGGPLTPDRPLTLRWDNGEGLAFTRTIAVDANYMFTVTERVENSGGAPVQLFPYALVSRTGTPKVSGFFILHEGPLGVFNGTLDEVKYDTLQEKGRIEHATTGGWIGITDKYWLTALVPDQRTPVKARFVHERIGNQDRYQVDVLGGAVTVAPGAAAETTTRLFAGAKQVTLLDGYSESLGIQRLDLAIDFGWFYFLTKPIFYILIYLHQWVGNFGIAILLLTVAIKLLFFPLANKSYKAMSKMKKLQPEMLKLRERFGEDRVRLNQEMMALYKREGANPASGCLPVIIQIPVFFALYKVLFVTIEMRHAPFFGWIKDLSAPDPTTLFNLFGLIPWQPPEFLMIGIWPLIMGGTMYLQQKLNPQPMDPVQAKVFMFLPLIFTVLLAPFPAGLVIYWAWNNILSVLQQWVIMKRMGVT